MTGALVFPVMSHNAHTATSEGGGLRRLVADYLEDLEISGKAEVTVKHYSAYLDAFLRWVSASTGVPVSALRPEHLTADGLRRYRLQLARRQDPKTKKPIVAATRNLYLIALRNFLRYCRRRRKVDVPDPDETIELAKHRQQEIRHLQRPEVVRIAEAVKLDGPNGLRDRAIIETLFGTGCRVSELVALRVRQLDLKRRGAEVIGKGGRSRLVLLTEDAAGWIERYLRSRADDSEYVFVSSRKADGAPAPLTTRQVQRIVEQATIRSGVPLKVSPHWFRHSRLTALARHAGVQAAQRIAGHASLQTTARYLHVTDPQLRQLYDRAEEADREAPT
ncbi:MAG TPA: tyrosine-type recombinase/integrase [Candidatus Limnocylindria bacterium]|nr:tyrosine-type recombinase/integrase [Candidatus Limnocylindria bacterium]